MHNNNQQHNTTNKCNVTNDNNKYRKQDEHDKKQTCFVVSNICQKWDIHKMCSSKRFFWLIWLNMIGYNSLWSLSKNDWLLTLCPEEQCGLILGQLHWTNVNLVKIHCDTQKCQMSPMQIRPYNLRLFSMLHSNIDIAYSN